MSTSPGSARARLSLLSLIAMNFAVFAGVLLQKIDVVEVLLLYWAESAVIGAFTVLKILTASARDPAAPELRAARPDSLFVRLFLAAFFCVHFGIFMFVHLLFLGGIVGAGAGGAPGAALPVDAALRYVASLTWMLAGMVLSHGVSFVLHFWIGGERESVPASKWFFRPYTRIFVMQATLILGLFMLMWSGSPLWLLAVLVVLKTIVDAVAHVREHRESAALQRTGEPPVDSVSGV